MDGEEADAAFQQLIDLHETRVELLNAPPATETVEDLDAQIAALEERKAALKPKRASRAKAE
jgi:hypothetical protein